MSSCHQFYDLSLEKNKSWETKHIEKNAAAAFNTMHHAVYTKYSQVFSCQLVPMHPSLSIKATYVHMYQIFINQSCHERVIYSAAEQADPE